MQERTLKEVAQAGLVLGFEWIARDKNDGESYLYARVPRFEKSLGRWMYSSMCIRVSLVEITDYPDLPPEKSLLKLRDIVEGVE